MLPLAEEGWKRNGTRCRTCGSLKRRCHHPLPLTGLSDNAVGCLTYATGSWTGMHEKVNGKCHLQRHPYRHGGWFQQLHCTRHQQSLPLCCIKQITFNGWPITMESLIGDNRRIKVCYLENNYWAILLKSGMDIRWVCCSLQQGHDSRNLF
jgi:hypothetical protein